MSPEKVAGVELDHRSDLFSLGSVMYFVATGREPFRADSAFAVINKITHETPNSARSMNADIPETLGRIIGRLLEKNPANRIQTADELRQLLTDYLAHLQDPQHHAQPNVKATTSERKKTVKRVVVGLAIFALAVASVFWTGFFPPNGDPVRFDGSEEQRSGIHDMGDLDGHEEAGHHEVREKEDHESGDTDR